MPFSSKIFSGLFLFLVLWSAPAFSQDWLTWYEQHQKNQTPDYAHTLAFSKDLAEASPLLHYTTFGVSPQQRELPLLILDKDGHFTASQVHGAGKTVLLIQAGIHPGESSGKDAGLTFLRDIVIHGKYQEFLEHVTILFIPIFNVDGHERFGPYNRINQNGPLEMGWRTNARNLNLNRDYLKNDTREMQDFVQLWNLWQPDFYIDTHATNGGDYQYPMTYILETFGNMDQALTQWSSQVFVPFWEAAMQEAGHPVFPYVSYRQWHDPQSGLVSRPSSPALSNGYAAVRNRPGLLLETHMLKPYHVRVQATYLTFRHTLELLHREHATLKRLVRQADQQVATPGFRTQPFALSFNVTDDSVMVDFLGVEYIQKKSEVSGGQWFIYESDQPKTYQIPYFKQMEPGISVMLPEAYIIPGQWQDVIRRLALHGIQMQILPEPASMEVEMYRFKEVRLAASVNEGRQTARFKVEPFTETRAFPAGSALITMNQPTARLIAHALEPQAPSSLAYWGEFNAVFQRTEYFESYAMEAISREMLANDPELKQRFEQKKQSDPDFAANPRGILEWFYVQTPYVDQQHNIYPVGRIMK